MKKAATRTFGDLTLTSGSVGVFLSKGDSNMLLPAEPDQWGEREAQEMLDSLSNLYGNMTEAEIVQHFRSMVEEGL